MSNVPKRSTKKDYVTDLNSPTRSREPAKANIQDYIFSDCGYTLISAADEKSKLNGDEFVCPACVVTKDKSFDVNAYHETKGETDNCVASLENCAYNL